VTGQNTTSRAQWIPITAKASNGFFVTAYVYVEPKFIDPPTFKSTPQISSPNNGVVNCTYDLDLGGREDQSLVSWSICNDQACSSAREIAISRGNQPLKTLVLMPGFAGKYLKATVQPKHEISDAGPAVYAISTAPVAATDIPSPNVSINPRNFVINPDNSYSGGLWTVLGPWSVAAEEELINGSGILSGNRPASLLYQEDIERRNMRIDLIMTPDKTGGQGFSIPGSPSETGERNLHSDIYIKYDPRTKNGYALRFWRTTQSSSKCMFQLYKIVNGIGSPIDNRQVLSGVFRPTITMTLKIIGNKFSADAANNVNGETLHLEGTIEPNRFGGAGVFWPGGSANTYNKIDISYP
jgi:hypothetical protein